MNALLGPLVLPQDILIIPAVELSEAQRLACACDLDDYVVTRPRSRARSVVINELVAELLRAFREPITIVDAILQLCRARGLSPELVLESGYAALQPFLSNRWLVPVDSAEAHEIEAGLAPGDRFGDWTILTCVNLLEDTEIYQARNARGDLAALKLGVPGSTQRVRKLFAAEARALARLQGAPGPDLLAEGVNDDLPYLLLEWRPGVHIDRIASDARREGDQHQLSHLFLQVARAYSVLHAKQIVHGDVAARNILVDINSTLTVIDFGRCRILDQPDVAWPGRVPHEYAEPEYAAALLAEARVPDLSYAGEQYSVAALIFRLATGSQYIHLPAERVPMLEAIINAQPRGFAEVGAPRWDALEACLQRALAKRPEHRFASMAGFARALQEVAEQHAQVKPRSTHRVVRPDADPLARFIADRSAQASRSEAIPTASIGYGAAGIGFALLASSAVREDPVRLAAADRWAARAVASMADAQAFTHPELGVSREDIGPASLLFGEPGVYLVQALVAHAQGDIVTLQAAIASFLEAYRETPASRDLTCGQAGALLGAGLLVDALGVETIQHETTHPLSAIMPFGTAMLAGLAAAVEASPLDDAGYLGIAHGIAGICYASLLWCEVTGQRLPEAMHTLITFLLDEALLSGRGARWAIRHATEPGLQPRQNTMDSWCHGAPGHLYLWLAAYRSLGDGRFLEMAERAAWTSWDSGEAMGSLCCGLTGRAYSLLAWYRQVNDPVWVDRAVTLSERARETCAKDRAMHSSLYKGSVGASLLNEDLRCPETASFPCFERELRGTSSS